MTFAQEKKNKILFAPPSLVSPCHPWHEGFIRKEGKKKEDYAYGNKHKK
jgi:hypothetical protein